MIWKYPGIADGGLISLRWVVFGPGWEKENVKGAAPPDACN